MSLAILFHFLCAQPHRNSNTHRTKNNTTNVVIQQNSCKLLMMDILMSETCWAHQKLNKIASDIKLVFYSSAITMMHGPINIRRRVFAPSSMLRLRMSGAMPSWRGQGNLYLYLKNKLQHINIYIYTRIIYTYIILYYIILYYIIYIIQDGSEPTDTFQIWILLRRDSLSWLAGRGTVEERTPFHMVSRNGALERAKSCYLCS